MPVCPQPDSGGHVEEDFLEIKGSDDVMIEAICGRARSAITNRGLADRLLGPVLQALTDKIQ